MSAVVRYAEDVDETGELIWSLGLRCGYTVTCKQREKGRQEDQRKRERKATGLDTFVFRLRNG